MPDVVATAEIDVRAKLDNFERDLVSVNKNVEKIDSSMAKASETTKQFHILAAAAFAEAAVAATTLIVTLSKMGSKEGTPNFGTVLTGSMAGATDSAKKMGNAFQATFKSMGESGQGVIGFLDEAEGKIEELVKVIKSAGAAGVEPEMFQRMQKAAEELQFSVESTTLTMQRFGQVTQQQYGGSAFERTLKALQQAGNFAAQTAEVAAVKVATSTEDRFKAVVKLINEAMESGERLAALKLAETFLPPEILERLRANNQLLDDWLQKATDIEDKDLISNKALANAAELKRRMEDASKEMDKATKSIVESFTPSLSTANTKSMDLYRTWVNIYEFAAKVADVLSKPPSFFEQPGAGMAKQIGGKDAEMPQFYPDREIAAFLKYRDALNQSGEAVTDFGMRLRLMLGDFNLTSQEIEDAAAINIAYQGALKSLRDDLTKVETSFLGTIKATGDYHKTFQAGIDLDAEYTKSLKAVGLGMDELTLATTEATLNINEEIEALEKFRQSSKQDMGVTFAENFAPQGPATQTADQQRQHLLLTGIVNQEAEAVNKLTIAFANHDNVTKAGQETLRVYVDQSKELEAYFIRIAERVSRSIALEQAHAQSIGQSAGEQNKLRVQMQLRSAMEMIAARDGKVFIDQITMSTEEMDKLRKAAEDQGKQVVEYGPKQIELMKQLSEEARKAGEQIARGSIELKVQRDTQAISLGLSKDSRKAIEEIARLEPNMTKAQKDELYGRIMANTEATRAVEIARDASVASGKFSADQVAAANKYRSAVEETADSVANALKTEGAQRELDNKETERGLDLSRERFIVETRMSADRKAAIDSMRSKFVGGAEGVKQGMADPDVATAVQTKAIDRLNQLKFESSKLSTKYTGDEIAALDKLKGSYDENAAGVAGALRSKAAAEVMYQAQKKRTMDIEFEYLKTSKALSDEDTQILSKLEGSYTHTAEGINKALNSTDAIRMRQTADIKTQRTVEFEYLTMSMGLTTQELAIVNQLKTRWGETGEGIKNALKSPQADWIRFNQTLQTARDTVSSFGTGFVQNVTNNLRQGMGQSQAFRQAFTTSLQGAFDQLAGMFTKMLIEKAFGAIVTTIFPAAAGGATTAAATITAAGPALGASMELSAGVVADTLVIAAQSMGAIWIANAEAAATIMAGVALAAAAQGGVVGQLPIPSFQGGGVVGLGEPQIIVAHKGEEVITRDDPRHRWNGGMSGGEGGGQATPPMTFTFAPTVHALDAAGVDRVLAEHGQKFAQTVATQWDRNSSIRPKY